MFSLNPASRLTLFLQLVALHSLAVGFGLIFIPAPYLELFGFNHYSASFFQVQGGVFHIVMCVAYWLAAKTIKSAPVMVHFVISAKTIAVVFLLIYFLYMETVWVIFVSAIGDGLMALLLFLFYKQYQHHLGEDRE